MNWEQIYKFLGIEEFILFITNPEIQEILFPVKMVFILFAAFFFVAVIYFYINSSYLKYQFLQDVIEFFSWKPYGFTEIERRWSKIKKMIDIGTESNLKTAFVEADDFLRYVLEDKGYDGETFEELIKSANLNVVIDAQGLVEAHKVRNMIVYEPDYDLDTTQAKRILSQYENAIKTIAMG